MPIIKSARKKLRQDKKRTQQNYKARKIVKTTILTFKRKPTASALEKVFSVLDTAVKKKVLHGNKASRLKSRLSKLLKRKPETSEDKSEVKIKSKSPRKAKTGV